MQVSILFSHPIIRSLDQKLNNHRNLKTRIVLKLNNLSNLVISISLLK
jgi:hypothetical protein